jgi:ankyrin repeat protein
VSFRSLSTVLPYNSAGALLGCGKSYVVASIAKRITLEAHSEKALLYVTCSGSASGDGLNNSQPYTADSICRTFLSQLYELAVQGEDNVGLLESCNSVFKKAKAKNKSLPAHMRSDSTGLPEFADGLSRIAALLKKNVVLVLDGLDKNALDDKDQEDLLRKLRGLMAAVSETAGTCLHIVVGCASSTKFFNELDLSPDSYVDVADGNSQDIELVLTDALKGIPGLTSAEQADAKTAILEKARSRFVYVLNTAIPFMREPFQRPLSRRLEALPDDINDAYSKALSKISPNYQELLRTALTWSLLSPEFPGFPFAREVMDGFQGTYDFSPDEDEDEGEEDEDENEDEDEIEPDFPPISRLEMEQLRAATEPFLKLSQNPDGSVWVYEPDPQAVADFFIKSEADVHEEPEDEEQLCARCGSTRSISKALVIDRKEGHLQMALTCLRHLNHPLFQKRAGLITEATEDSEDEDEDAEGEGSEDEEERDTEEGQSENANPDETASQAPPQAGEEEADADQQNADGKAENNLIDEFQSGYQSEDSIDDEDVTQPGIYDLDVDELMFGGAAAQESEDDDGPNRVRYELQYWPWHIREAEKLWPAEERATNSDWAALMKELDTFALETPDVFAAWQDKYPDEEADEAYFCLDNGPHKPLHVAAYLRFMSWTTHLLDRGEELNELSGGYSALQAAACAGDGLEIMKVLLEQGADINAENEAGRTAFQQWLLRGDVTLEGARTLLEHGADPRRSSSLEHFNALHYFASKGEDPELLDLLLAHGADINGVDPEDQMQAPPLHILLMRRDVPGPLLEAFIKSGADTNSENAGSARPLQMICTHGQFDNLKILLRSEVLEIDDPDLHGTTAVHESVFYGHSNCVRELLEHGANPDIPDKLSRVALHTAARKGYSDSVRALVQHSQNINLLDKNGWSPLFCACISKDEWSASLILDALIDRNVPLADINKPTRCGRTALRQAADHGFDSVVYKLINLAKIRDDTAPLALNTPDTKKNQTPLHRAAMRGHAACVRALLSANADATIPDKSSRTALSLAYDQWAIATASPAYEEIIALLIDADPRAATTDADLVAVCAANGSTTLLQKLWRLHADLNRPDRYGWTPLDLARNFGRTEAEAFLKQQAAWKNMLPTKWGEKFPATTPVGGLSVRDEGKRIVHTSGKRVSVSAERPLPAGLEGYYFEVTLLELEEGEEGSEFGEMAVGFCTLGGAAIEFPGWPVEEEGAAARSWGYH